MRPFTLKRSRSGFTLIELLVAMGIIVTLSTLALMIVPKMNSNNAVIRAADQISSWTVGSRNRALRDKAPRGIRLISNDPTNPNWVTGIELIEQPAPFRPVASSTDPLVNGQPCRLTVTVNETPPNSGNFLANQIATINGYADSTNQSIQVGDYLLINARDIYRINAVVPDTTNNKTTLQVNADGIVDVRNGKPLNTDNYQIIRRWRPLAGETALQLPKDIIIDVSPVTYSSPGVIDDSSRRSDLSALSTNERIIMFSKGGPIVDTNGGKIILWVANRDNDGDPVLITIYTRTGAVSSQAVGPPGDVYQFTRDGRGSGL